MRRMTWMSILSAWLGLASHGFAQQKPRPSGPVVPVFQPNAPQMNPTMGRVNVANPSQLQAGVNNVPGSTVYTAPRNVGYQGGPGSVYVINRYNNPNNGLYGPPSGGFQGMQPNSGQFYAFLGGPAATNPFQSNVAPMASTWARTTGVGPNGQPWNLPFNSYNFNVPQYPAMYTQAPIVGQSNGFINNQLPLNPLQQQQGNFGVQIVPGLNAPGGLK